MRYSIVFIGLMGLLLSARAQYTLTGLKGLMNVPEADVLEEATFLIGVHTNAQEYLLINYNNRRDGDEYISVASVGFCKRFSVTLMLSRIFGDPKQSVGELSSIGDRSLQLTYLLLEEKTFWPSLAINITDPLFSSNQYLAGNHVVATKSFWSKSSHVLRTSLGYGLPYLLTLTGQEKRQVKRKDSDFLTGFFGGIRYTHAASNLNASFEYDGWNLNAGLGVVFWERLSLQAYLQNFKYPGLGVNFLGKIH